MNEITDHHDGHGLNDRIRIDRDPRDPDNGNGSHTYEFFLERENGQAMDDVGVLRFQHGPRDAEGSRPGLTGAAVLAALIDHYRGFQEGPFACRENALIITKLEEALHWARHRADERRIRGVLGRRAP